MKKSSITKISGLLLFMLFLALAFWYNSPIKYLSAPEQIILYNNGKSMTLDKNHEDYEYLLNETRSLMKKNVLSVSKTKSSLTNIIGPESTALELIYKQPLSSGVFIILDRNKAEMFVSGEALGYSPGVLRTVSGDNSKEYKPGGTILKGSSNLASFITENL